MTHTSFSSKPDKGRPARPFEEHYGDGDLCNALAKEQQHEFRVLLHPDKSAVHGAQRALHDTGSIKQRCL